MPFYSSIKKYFRPARAVVLMYHRIAEPEIDPWQLAVSKKNFREHLKILTSYGNVISTDQLIENIRNKKLDSDCFCITSDDGYQDNYINALPLIEEFSFPSTFFITSGSIDSDKPFWWDVLTNIFLAAKKLPSRLDVTINKKRFCYILENDGKIGDQQIKKHSSWQWQKTPPTQRCEIYFELWMYLRDLPANIIVEAINGLSNWSGEESINDSGNFPMSSQELLSMSESKFVKTGIHTVTHAALGTLSKSIQESEINGCRKYLEDKLGRDHLSIAFPYGNYNSDTLDIAKHTGLRGAFTTEPKAVTIKSEIYRLGRFQVINLTGEQFKVQIEKWLNN